MERRATRRRVLSAAGVGLGGWAVTPSAIGRDAAQDTESPFDPVRHGFGFRNWSTRAPDYPEHNHATVTEGPDPADDPARLVGFPRRTRRGRRHRDAQALIDTIAKQIYISANQFSATNGHCYGMSFAAQSYYENPSRVPLDRTLASECDNPAVPLDDPDQAPVGQDIDGFQTQQLLDFYAWIGRRALVRPQWIDYPAQLEHLTAAVEEYGMAGITLQNTTTRPNHQVLVYGVRRWGTLTQLAVYEPNQPADRYTREREPQFITVEGDSVRPYADDYDAFVFNRYDRSIATRGRGAPLDAIDAGGSLLSETAEASIEPGETHTYVARVPASAGGPGRLSQAEDGIAPG